MSSQNVKSCYMLERWVRVRVCCNNHAVVYCIITVLPTVALVTSVPISVTDLLSLLFLVAPGSMNELCCLLMKAFGDRQTIQKWLTVWLTMSPRWLVAVRCVTGQHWRWHCLLLASHLTRWCNSFLSPCTMQRHWLTLMPLALQQSILSGVPVTASAVQFLAIVDWWQMFALL